MPKLTARAVAELIVDHTHDLSKTELPTVMKDIVGMLGSMGLMSKWREIEREIHNAWKRKFGASMVTVLSAHPMTVKARKQLEEIAPGADIVERVDERLMAGAVIRIDDRRIDGSMAGRLARLKQQLMN